MKANLKLIYKLSIVLIALNSILFTSCEEVFLPEDVKAKEEYVVEGHIELSDLNIPAYVILSKSISYFSTFDTAVFKNIYIDDAEVFVNDGKNDIKLDYVCILDLDPVTQLKVLSDAATKVFSKDMCLYLDKDNKIEKVEGRTYTLTIKHNGKILKSKTSIAKRVKLDSIYYKDPPGKVIDSMTLLWVKFTDPASELNFYKYDIKNRSFTPSTGNTLRNDEIFNGQTIDFPLPNPLSFDRENFDPETANLYKRGDTLLFKWCSMDKEHYEFWESFQFSNNQGPFSSYIRAKDNIDGGIGIWGAYNCQVELIVIPEK